MTGSMPGIIRLSTKDTSFRQKDQIVHRNCRKIPLLDKKTKSYTGTADYPRFGYRRASAYGISFPFDAPDECCMAAELTEGGLDGIHGMVKYPDAFLLE